MSGEGLDRGLSRPRESWWHGSRFVAPLRLSALVGQPVGQLSGCRQEGVQRGIIQVLIECQLTQQENLRTCTDLLVKLYSELLPECAAHQNLGRTRVYLDPLVDEAAPDAGDDPDDISDLPAGGEPATCRSREGGRNQLAVTFQP